MGIELKDHYVRIKDIFTNVLCNNKKLENIKFTEYFSKVDYINDVYQITKEKYISMFNKMYLLLNSSDSKTSAQRLNKTELDKMILEVIYSNLYCDFVLILSILSDSYISRKTYINQKMPYELTVAEHNKYVQRNEQRIKDDRINSKVRLNPDSYIGRIYIPCVHGVYKDILFLHSKDTLKISKNFADIYDAVFIDIKEEKEFSDNQKILKSRQLWNFSESTLKLILDIYKNIYTHPQSKYAIAEYMILEKMFGLKTIDSFVRKFSTDEDLINNIRNISPSMQKLIRLGYTNLHDKLIEKVKVQSKNILETNANGDIENDSEYLDYDALEDIIDDFLYPVCTECMQIILNDIMNYLKARKVEDRIAIVEKMVQICSKYNKNLFSISEISQNEKCSLKIFKSLYDIPDEISKTEIINYVIDEWDLKEITTEKLESKTDELNINVFDIRYEDLTYIVKQEYDDLFNYTREELLNDCLEARHKMDEKKIMNRRTVK